MSSNLRAHHCRIAGVVLDAFLLLEARLVGLVDHNQAEVWVGQEQGRARAHRDRRFATGDPAPRAAALRGAKIGMPGHRLAAETGLKTLEEGLGERDLGEQDKRLLALPEAFGDRLEINLGLAGTGDAIEQDRVESLADGGSKAGGGLALIVVELRRRVIGIGAGEGPVRIDRNGFERAGVDQPPQDRVADAGMIGKLVDRALTAFERGKRFLALRGEAVGDMAGRPIFDELARALQRGR